MASIISCRRGFRRLVIATGLAAACGAPSTPPAPSPRAPSPTATTDARRVVFLGDSLSAGLGLAESDAFPAVAGTILHDAGIEIEVVNAGVSGDTSAGGLARIDWVLAQIPDILVVELGGNDALRGQPLEHTESNLREIVRRGRSSGARVLLLGMDVPTNYGPEYGKAFAVMYERVAADEGVTLVPGFVREVGADPDLLQPDGLHPTAEGQRRLAATIAPYLAEMVSGEEPEN